jgi:hypothetical protein
MSPATPCCRDFQSLTAAESPFAKIIALGFYDGPTSGILQCRTCGRVYGFDMLDWDEGHGVRIFRLALLPPDALDRCVSALAPYGPPQWPVWVPARANLPSEETGEVADRQVERILGQAEPAELVVAWTGYGDRVLAAKSVPAAELVDAPDWFSVDDPSNLPDWFSLLGLAKWPKGTIAGVD